MDLHKTSIKHIPFTLETAFVQDFDDLIREKAEKYLIDQYYHPNYDRYQQILNFNVRVESLEFERYLESLEEKAEFCYIESTSCTLLPVLSVRGETSVIPFSTLTEKMNSMVSVYYDNPYGTYLFQDELPVQDLNLTIGDFFLMGQEQTLLHLQNQDLSQSTNEQTEEMEPEL